MTSTNPLAPADAARLLRAARRDPESVEWAFLALPSSTGAQRLRIEQLIADGDLEAAEALIARVLLQRPSDATLARLRAECCLRRDELRDADREVRFALDRRPNHVGTLVLAGRIARRAGDLPVAIERFDRASEIRPRSDSLRRSLVDTLLEAGALTRAERILGTMSAPCPVLEAQLLAAQGRILEAIERLERVIDSPGDTPPCDRDEATGTLVVLLERAGHVDRLRTRMETIGPDQPRALVAAGRAWLALGEHRRAVARLATLRVPGPWRREAMGVIAVAASLVGRPSLAERALRRLQRTREGADPAVMADLWRRGLTAETLSGPLSASVAGETCPRGLQGILASAIDLFAGGRSRPVTGDDAQHLATCLAAAGRGREARETLVRSAPPPPHPAGHRTIAGTLPRAA
ncbi:MAG: tetratricopeptide repeat protein [Planctomycetes bacterium]|nr:tetratricopeptide repeat protein [Planctomycetota bacterium]